MYIAPVSAGDGSGSSWANAAALASMNSMVQAAGAGGEVLLRADQGAYNVSGALGTTFINSGGADGAPVTIRGVDGAGASLRAQFVGGRADPWPYSGGGGGPEVFNLGAGAGHLVFEDMSFKNTGEGVFRLADAMSDITIQDMDATNFRRFVWNRPADVLHDATVSGLTVRDLDLNAFSKSAFDIRYDSHDILIENVRANSMAQDGDDYAMGVHLDDTVHDAVIRNVSVVNTRDDNRGKPGYWNGDGFATERGVHDIVFENTYAGQNSDAGYDLKSSATLLLNVTSEGNKRNFRLWSDGVTIQDSHSLEPVKAGGTNIPAHFWLDAGASPTIINTEIKSSSPGTITFDLSESGGLGSLTVSGSDIDTAGTLFSAVSGASLVIDGVAYGATSPGVLEGTEGRDSLKGDAGANVLHGNGGDDSLAGGLGADQINGGAGNDTAVYATSSLGVTVDISTGAASGGEATGDTLSGIENLRGSEASDRLTGDSHANYISGGSGDDTIDGGAGADTLLGETGYDTSSYGRSAAGVSVDLISGASSGGDAAGDVISGFENLQGSAFADKLYGTEGVNVLGGRAGADLLEGRGGDDTLDGGAGADVMKGGSGNDIYVVDDVGDQVVELAGGGIDTIRTTLSSFSLAGLPQVEALTYIGAGGFTGTGGDLADTITGGAGADTLYGNLGADRLSGADGSDTLRGGGGDDVLSGGNEGDQLFGGDGADTLSGGNNNDNLYGEAGDDKLFGDGGSDKLDGGDGADLLDGGTGTDTLKGGAGADTLAGGGSADVLDGGADFDTATYLANPTAVTVNLATGVLSGGDATGDKLISIEQVVGSNFGDTLIGGAAVDTLDGAGGADLIDGGGGADRMIGGAGDDTYVVDQAGDVIVEAPGEGTDTVRTALATYTLGANVENLSADGAGGLNGRGNTSGNVLTGGDGADVLYGKDGSDTLNGGGGADTLFGENESDTLSGGAGNDILWGGGNNDKLSGDAGNDKLMGEGGNDNLFGGDGADTLDGGVGKDILTGGAGDDLFVFAKGYGHDIVTDFAATESIRIAGFTSVSEVKQVGADTLLVFDAADDLLLKNVDSHTLTADHWFFV